MGTQYIVNRFSRIACANQLLQEIVCKCDHVGKLRSLSLPMQVSTRILYSPVSTTNACTLIFKLPCSSIKCGCIQSMGLQASRGRVGQNKAATAGTFHFHNTGDFHPTDLPAVGAYAYQITSCNVKPHFELTVAPQYNMLKLRSTKALFLLSFSN